MPLNFTLRYADRVNDIDDTTGDVAATPGVGPVYFDTTILPGYRIPDLLSSPPTGLATRRFSGYLDTDGLLKKERGGEEGVRLWRRLERRSLLVRQAAGEQTRPQVIAANIDTIFVTCAIHQEFNVRRVERYLALVEESGATPVVILNKADLVDESLQERVREQIAQIAPEVDCVVTSMKDGRGISALEAYLEPGHTIALIGSSGVGKSTLINELHGEQVQATGAVREQDGKGRHTTTTRQLVVLPSGGLLVDTPGMRELGLWQADESALEAFPEIERLGAECKFRDCSHESEVGCAVKRAIEDGEIEAERVDSWRKLKEEIEFQRERQREIERIERRRGAKVSKNKSSS